MSSETVMFDLIVVNITDRFVEAVKELMEAKCEMMAQADTQYADCWTWGRCVIHDLDSTTPMSFTYGGDEDMPDDGLGRFGVSVADAYKPPPEEAMH